MAINKADVEVFAKHAKARFEQMVATIRDKGAKRFLNAIGIAAAFVFAAYWFVYTPPQNKIARLDKEIDAARAMSQSGARYRDLRDQLAGSYGSLPFLKDQQQWLSNAMMDSLRADNLTPESFRPVSESESSGLIFQTSTVILSLRFNEIYSWLLRLESAKPLMHIGVLEITKRPDMIGMNGVSCSVVTAIPRKRYD